MPKSRDAFRTISEVAEWLETPAHVLRFWESKFTQVKPVKRAGGRRYYRPSDMELLGGIKKLLHDDGMTIKGVQKVLREQGVRHVASLSVQPVDPEEPAQGELIEDAPYAEVPLAEAPDPVIPYPARAPAPQQHQAESATAEPEADPTALDDAETDQDNTVAEGLTEEQTEAVPAEEPAETGDLSDSAPEQTEPLTADAQLDADETPAESPAPEHIAATEAEAIQPNETGPQPALIEGADTPDLPLAGATASADTDVEAEAPSATAETDADSVPDPDEDPVPESSAEADPQEDPSDDNPETEEPIAAAGSDDTEETAEEKPDTLAAATPTRPLDLPDFSAAPKPAQEASDPVGPLAYIARISALSPQQKQQVAAHLPALRALCENRSAAGG